MANDPVDLHVGQMVRARRHVMKLTQAELGEATGVTFQQIQKYECGANRISASMLWRIAHALRAEVGDFFPETSFDGEKPGLGELAGLATSRDGQEIGRLWREMTPGGQLAFLSIAKAIAASARPGGQVQLEEAAALAPPPRG